MGGTGNLLISMFLFPYFASEEFAIVSNGQHPTSEQACVTALTIKHTTLNSYISLVSYLQEERRVEQRKDKTLLFTLCLPQ